MAALVVMVLLTFALVLSARATQGQAARVGAAEVGGFAAEAQVGLGGSAEGVDTRVVLPGETLWGIATELAPGQDPRPIVDILVEQNGSTLQAGQTIVIPVELS